jgi:hypothetical protein
MLPDNLFNCDKWDAKVWFFGGKWAFLSIK